MTPTPQQAKLAVNRVLSEVDKENEAAYRVIVEAVKVCIASGMKRREVAKFLGVQPRRIDRRGQYFRSLLATRNLFRGALNANDRSSVESEAVAAIVRRAWRR